jgi:hypothetical protein
VDWEGARCIGVAQEVVRTGQLVAHVVSLYLPLGSCRGGGMEISDLYMQWGGLTFRLCGSGCLIHGLELGLGLLFAIGSYNRRVIWAQDGSGSTSSSCRSSVLDDGLEFSWVSLFEICLWHCLSGHLCSFEASS